MGPTRRPPESGGDTPPSLSKGGLLPSSQTGVESIRQVRDPLWLDRQVIVWIRVVAPAVLRGSHVYSQALGKRRHRRDGGPGRRSSHWLNQALVLVVSSRQGG